MAFVMTTSYLGLTAVTCIAVSISLVLYHMLRKTNLPYLPDPVPYIFNTVQFVNNNARFMQRTSELFERTDIGKFYLMFTPVWLLSGAQNIHTFFTRSNTICNERTYLQVALPGLYNMHAQDIRRFASDKSGRERQPLAGTEHMEQDDRYWYGFHHVHSEYLSRPQYYRPLARRYRDLMTRTLGRLYPVGIWKRLSLTEFCRRHVAETSIEMLFGPRMLELNPDLVDAYWAFDDHMMTLCLLPRWLVKSAHNAQMNYHRMLRQYIEDVSTSSVDETERLVPTKILEWVRSKEFHEQSINGTLATLIFALISNTVPITMWILMEVFTDPSLLRAIREEVATAFMHDDTNAAEELNVERLNTLPLLQSTFAEVLRLHMSFNLLRNAREPLQIDGFRIEKGNMLSAPMQTAHYNEQTWGAPEHPADEFWAERHVRYRATEGLNDDKTQKYEKVFSLEGRSSWYFPFGGGSSICPGRALAKSEVLTTVALAVSKMDIELEGWRSADNKPSVRGALNDPKYSGVGAMFPDRDLRCLWRRRY